MAKRSLDICMEEYQIPHKRSGVRAPQRDSDAERGGLQIPGKSLRGSGGSGGGYTGSLVQLGRLERALIYYFSDPASGKPIEKYLLQVGKRFGQRILDTTCREYNREWLDYQYEIGLRHHRAEKGKQIT